MKWWMIAALAAMAGPHAAIPAEPPAPPTAAATGLLTTQVGHHPGEAMRALVRSDRADGLGRHARFVLRNASGSEITGGPVTPAGAKWGSHWWIADFTGQLGQGTYTLTISHDAGPDLTSDPIEVRNRILWNACYDAIAHDLLEQRARMARIGKGWRDCGSDLQELSSHVVTVDCLCDLIEKTDDLVTSSDRARLREQVVVGCDFIAHLQDLAKQRGLGDGPVVHEPRQTDLTTGNTVKAAMILARAARLLRESDPVRSADYLARAVRAYEWIKQHGPIVPAEQPTFFPHVHGLPAGSKPPADQWMTRDLLMMARAAVELVKAGMPQYREEAVRQAAMIVRRQIPQDRAEGGYYGHFLLYDDFSSLGGRPVSEKAVIHCGAWSKEGRIYNKGGHYPHHVIPLIEMLALWPQHADARRWKRCIHDFAYGYFLPACQSSPLLILPNGYYPGQGLLHFSSWYHGQSGMYAFAAILALEFEELFADPRFRSLAVANIQWIAGLNCGWRDRKSNVYRAYSLIEGIGHRHRTGWSKIKGSIINGYSASPQFRITPPLAATDKPAYFDNEDYIAHTLPFLAAVARLEVAVSRRCRSAVHGPDSNPTLAGPHPPALAAEKRRF